MRRWGLCGRRLGQEGSALLYWLYKRNPRELPNSMWGHSKKASPWTISVSPSLSALWSYTSSLQNYEKCLLFISVTLSHWESQFLGRLIRSPGSQRRRKRQIFSSILLCLSLYNNVSYSRTCFSLTRIFWLILLSYVLGLVRPFCC